MGRPRICKPVHLSRLQTTEATQAALGTRHLLDGVRPSTRSAGGHRRRGGWHCARDSSCEHPPSLEDGDRTNPTTTWARGLEPSPELRQRKKCLSPCPPEEPLPTRRAPLPQSSLVLERACSVPPNRRLDAHCHVTCVLPEWHFCPAQNEDGVKTSKNNLYSLETHL